MVEKILERARETLQIEMDGIQELMERLDERFEKAVDLLYHCQGKVIVTGMGKSGLIGQKIAATLTSTGTPAIFLHAAESFHGDLGVISQGDVVLAISNKGETSEIVQMLGHITANGIPLIGMTGVESSPLAESSDVFLSIRTDKEACPLGLAPTTSTTVTLALGDALAMCLLEKRQFKEEDFLVFHPGGSLGKKLTITVGDLMVADEQLPLVNQNTLMREAVHEMSKRNLGILIAVDDSDALMGVFSVGDLMRLIEKQENFIEKPLSQYMSHSPKTINETTLAAKALHLMQTHSITCLVVADSQNHPIGLLQIYDILRAGVY